MQQRDVRLLILIGLVALVALWLAWPTDPGLKFLGIDRDITVRLGLDLQGGAQVLLEADVPEDQPIDADSMKAVRRIVENRVNGLGVIEPTVQTVGSRRIQVEIPGIEDAESAIEILRETALMEWVDTGQQYVAPGTVIKTDHATAAETAETLAATGTITSSQAISNAETIRSEETIYHTVLTGRNLEDAAVEFTSDGLPVIGFTLDDEGAEIFADHTASNQNRFLAIVLDKQVISCPIINEPIPDGRGMIQGDFSVDQAKAMVLQLQYGALPIPLREVDTRTVGPSLGQDSVDKSVQAGIIGLVAVLLFMLIYYLLPGLVADLALLIYGCLTLALYKVIPVTLTLPGIAGSLLSLGMAVDANILIFERMREELRHGRSLRRAIDVGFRRAWSSILDSNISTWITCGVLWAFGNSFGASTVKGFAITLGMGVVVSMFTAVTVSRTFLRAVFAIFGERLRDKTWLLGA